MSDDNHEHHHAITIDPKELSSGSVLANTDLNQPNHISIATSRVSLDATGHDGEEHVLSYLSPIHFILVGLARSTTQTLRMVVEMQKLDITSLYVAVSQQPEDGKTTITREIIIEGSASDEEREMLKKMAEKCPVSQFLGGELSINTVVA